MNGKLTGVVLLLASLQLIYEDTIAAGTSPAKSRSAAQAAEIKRLRNDVNVLRRHIERLERICRRAGVKLPPRPSLAATDPTAPKSSEEPFVGPISYRGKPRTQKWFETMYARFSDKIAFLGDGKYADIGKARFRPLPEIDVIPPAPGTEYRTTPPECRILQVQKKKKRIIILRPSKLPQEIAIQGIDEGSDGWRWERTYSKEVPELIFCIEGENMEGLVDKTPYSANLIYLGTMRYDQNKTIQRYRLCKPLTRKQFADYLKKGNKLFQYRLRRVMLRLPRKKNMSPEQLGYVPRRDPRTGRTIWHKISRREIQ